MAAGQRPSRGAAEPNLIDDTVLSGASGNLSITDAASGSETVSLSDSRTGTFTMSGDGADETISGGGDLTENITLSSGTDSFTASNGSVNVTAGTGTDVLSLGTGTVPLFWPPI